MQGCVPSRLRSCLALLLLLGALGYAAAAPDVASLPAPTGYVSDLAHVIDAADKENLEAFCTRVEQELGVQFALVTIDRLGDTPIENFTLALARKWGVGSKKDNQGVLLLLVIKDHRNRIEVGRGIEPYITDGFSGGTLRSMRPDLRSGNYGTALLAGAREMAAQIAQGKNLPFAGAASQLPPPTARERGRTSRGIPGGFIAIIILIAVIFLLSRRGGGRGGYGGGGGGGFLMGILLGNLLGGGRRGGGWGGGGGFGGDSGGGGGFGGFGGGDFGGGGASSDW